MASRRSILDWTLFACLSLLWASAYALTRLAVGSDTPERGLPPELIIPIRMTGGAILLVLVALMSGQAWPPLRKWRLWLAMAVMGAIATTAPFYVITHAQRTVDSSLAALYVAAAPLFVAILAHFSFHDDRLSPTKTLGIVIGFGGVAVLFGPDAIKSFGSASVVAQALCLLATLFYATSSILARFFREIPPLPFAASFVSFGAIVSWPMLFSVDWTSLAPAPSAMIGVAGLAIGPTAAASILYMIVIQRTSATFLSLTGYVIPILSAIIGFIAFRETQDLTALIGFSLILGGVWLSQQEARKTLSQRPIQ